VRGAGPSGPVGASAPAAAFSPPEAPSPERAFISAASRPAGPEGSAPAYPRCAGGFGSGGPFAAAAGVWSPKGFRTLQRRKGGGGAAAFGFFRPSPPGGLGSPGNGKGWAFRGQRVAPRFFPSGKVGGPALAGFSLRRTPCSGIGPPGPAAEGALTSASFPALHRCSWRVAQDGLSFQQRGNIHRSWKGVQPVKAAFWGYSDAEARKHGEQKGLDTPVVHAANDEC